VPDYLAPERLTVAEVTRRRREARSRRSSSSRWPQVAVALILVAALTSGTAVATNAFGAGDKFERLIRKVQLAINPPPDRPTEATVDITPEPTESPTPSPSLAAGASAPPPTPAPVRKAVDVRILTKPNAYFASEYLKDWCAPAGVQMVLAILGHADTSTAFQRTLQDRVGEWESYSDSHNGEWGPAAMVQALAAYGAPGYKIHAHKTRDAALRDAAVALQKTHAPVIIIAWRGAHTWVMTGFRANADPSVFNDAKVTGTYILDPWYPRVSSIWGPSDPPGTFQDTSEMIRNFLPWKRPEGRYPDRDNKFLIVVPTIAVKPVG
jgi:peptidase C39-like protein